MSVERTGNKERYEELCRREQSIGLFAQGWWLDAACGTGEWDVAMVADGEMVRAALPYQIRRRGIFTILTQPPLTPWLGPWMADDRRKSGTVVGRENQLMTALIGQLPRFDRFSQNWPYWRTNWLPFYWQGFKQTTRYTYVLNDLSSEDSVWAGMRSNARREIRKAERRYGLRTRDDVGLDALLRLNDMTYARQGKRAPHGEVLRRLDEACTSRNCGKALVAEDGRGRHHAGGYFVWDGSSAYYLVGGIDPGLRSSGAMSLVMWDAIRFARTVTRNFDFEGSMIESVEHFFRSFGGEQLAYSHVSKTPSRLLRVIIAGMGSDR